MKSAHMLDGENFFHEARYYPHPNPTVHYSSNPPSELRPQLPLNSGVSARYFGAGGKGGHGLGQSSRGFLNLFRRTPNMNLFTAQGIYD